MIRTDIAALIHAGHSDTHIAQRLGCHRSTVNWHRNMMLRPLAEKDRLVVEQLPTGRVRDYDRRREPVAAERAAENRRALEDALGLSQKPKYRGRRDRTVARNLRAVPDQEAA